MYFIDEGFTFRNFLIDGTRRGRSPNESEVLMRISSRQATEGAKHADDNSTIIACTSR